MAGRAPAVCITLPGLAAAAARYADTCEAKAAALLAKERAAYSGKDEGQRNRDLHPASSWEKRWDAQQRARSARKLADALAGLLADFGLEAGQ